MRPRHQIRKEGRATMKYSMAMISMKVPTTLFESNSPRRGVGTVKEGRKVADAEESA